MALKSDFKECVAEIGSMTQTMRAQKLLSQSAIPTTVVKSSASDGSTGCAYGLLFFCEHKENVENLLAKGRIRVKRWKPEA